MNAPPTQPLKMMRKLCTECSRKIEVKPTDLVCIVCDGPLVDIPVEKKKPKVETKQLKLKFDATKLAGRELSLHKHFSDLISKTKPGPVREALMKEFVRKFLETG